MSDATAGAVRRAVRSVVEGSPTLRANPALARRVAQPMVKVSMAAARLLELERDLDDALDARAATLGEEPLATAQAAPRPPTGVVASAANVIRDQRRALDFPEFVTSLITGVFQAISTSNVQQLEAVADLLQSVGTAADDFGTEQIGDARAAEWLTRKVRGLEADAEGHLRWRQGTEPRTQQELARAVGATGREATAIDPESLDETLLPLARRRMARDRQSLLSTMVLMGMQRVVVDAGRITASMELEVGARSENEERHDNRTDMRVSAAAGASFGVGAWGAQAKVSTSVGHVRDDRQFSRDEIASRAALRSTVQVAFHTEPVALDRMASPGQVRGFQERALVPDFERNAATQAPLLSAGATGPRITQTQFEAPPSLINVDAPEIHRPPANSASGGAADGGAANPPAGDAPAGGSGAAAPAAAPAAGAPAAGAAPPAGGAPGAGAPGAVPRPRPRTAPRPNAPAAGHAFDPDAQETS